jgi:hypothetical protein
MTCSENVQWLSETRCKHYMLCSVRPGGVLERPLSLHPPTPRGTVGSGLEHLVDGGWDGYIASTDLTLEGLVY